MGHALVVGRQALALAAVTTTKRAKDTERLLAEDVVVFQDEGLFIASLSELD